MASRKAGILLVPVDGRMNPPHLGSSLKNRDMKSKRLIAGAFAYWLLFIAPASMAQAQTGGDPDTPRFEARAYAALFELRVTRANGSIVTGLEADDFAVYEEGRRRPIAAFEERNRVPVCLALLVDSGNNMSRDGLSTAKQLIFDLVHRLDPQDEVLVATYAKEVHYLSELTRDRRKLTEGLTNLAVGGRSGKLARLGSLFGSNAYTGYAVDETLLKMGQCRADNRFLLVFSAGFGNIGQATLDHLERAGVRFFGVGVYNRLGDAFNLGGDQKVRRRIEKRTGGIHYSSNYILEQVQDVAMALKHHYRVAYLPGDLAKDLVRRRVEFQLPDHPDWTLHWARVVQRETGAKSGF